MMLSTFQPIHLSLFILLAMVRGQKKIYRGGGAAAVKVPTVSGVQESLQTMAIVFPVKTKKVPRIL